MSVNGFSTVANYWLINWNSTTFCFRNSIRCGYKIECIRSALWNSEWRKRDNSLHLRMVFNFPSVSFHFAYQFNGRNCWSLSCWQLFFSKWWKKIVLQHSNKCYFTVNSFLLLSYSQQYNRIPGIDFDGFNFCENLNSIEMSLPP